MLYRLLSHSFIPLQALKFIFLILTWIAWTTCPLTGSCSSLEFNRLWTSAISQRSSMCSRPAAWNHASPHITVIITHAGIYMCYMLSYITIMHWQNATKSVGNITRCNRYLCRSISESVVYHVCKLLVSNLTASPKSWIGLKHTICVKCKSLFLTLETVVWRKQSLNSRSPF